MVEAGSERLTACFGCYFSQERRRLAGKEMVSAGIARLKLLLGPHGNLMAEDDKIVQSIKFLLKSVKQLSDRFLQADAKQNQAMAAIHGDLSDLRERMEHLGGSQLEAAPTSSFVGGRQTPPELPVRPDTANRLIPALNLSVTAILDVYANTPVLLEPFARPCGVSGRTLSGEIEAVELETFAQGTTWALETLDSGWLLVPRPGTLERVIQLQTLERLYDVDGSRDLPALLHLIRPASAQSVVFGRRWQLKTKGVLSTTADPLKSNPWARLAQLEERLVKLEARA